MQKLNENHDYTIWELAKWASKNCPASMKPLADTFAEIENQEKNIVLVDFEDYIKMIGSHNAA